MSAPAPRTEPSLITDAAALDALCDRLEELRSFAFDTEFVGEDQFRPEVCLIQVAADSEIYLIDPLADLCVERFWRLVADPAVEKIVHAGMEDIAQTWYTLDLAPRNIFDLQIAAGLIGYGYPISLSRLAQVAVKRKLHKSQTLSDWRRRPLHPDQVLYAAEDVAYLHGIYDRIKAKLEKLGRVEWNRDECAEMCRATAPTDEPEVRLKRLKGAGALSPRELAIAYAILDEREKLATEYNRPVRTVIRDHIVIELSRYGLDTVDKLRSVRGLSLNKPATARIASVIEEAKKIPKEAWPVLPNKEDAPHEDLLIDLLAAVLKDFCLQNQLSYGLLCKKQWLRDFVRSHTRPDVAAKENPLTTSWREECIGRPLELMMNGTATIRVKRSDAGHRIVLDEGE